MLATLWLRGFALTIGRARFFFTPGVPSELRRMLEEQIMVGQSIPADQVAGLALAAKLALDAYR